MKVLDHQYDLGVKGQIYLNRSQALQTPLSFFDLGYSYLAQ